MKTSIFINSMIALAIALVMVSCGGSGSKQTDGKKTDVEAAKELVSKAEDKSITADNWQKVVKKEFGIDLAIPNGWKFNQVKALTFSDNLITILIKFEKTDDNATPVSETAKTLFDRTNALSSEGNFYIDVDINNGKMSKGETYATFDACFKPDDFFDGVTGLETLWYYKDASGIKLVDISAKKGLLTVKLEFNKALKL